MVDGASYQRGGGNELYNLKQEFHEFRKQRYDEIQESRKETIEWRRQHNDEFLQFKDEVKELRKAVDVLVRMVSTVEQQTISTKEMTTSESRQMREVYQLLRGDTEGRGGILGRLAQLEFRSNTIESRKEETHRELFKKIDEIYTETERKIDAIAKTRDQTQARLWQLVISMGTGSLAAFALSRLLAP